MRHSVSYVEPKIALAGERQVWHFIYLSSSDLPEGTRLLFDLDSLGKEMDWEVPNVDLKRDDNVIWMTLSEDSSPVEAKAIYPKGHKIPQFEFILPSLVHAGNEIAIVVGTSCLGQVQQKGNRAQCYAARRRPFYLRIEPKGQKDQKITEVFHVDVRGNQLHHIRMAAPSVVYKNQRFDLITRFEDRYGNLTGKASEGTLIELSYENFQGHMNWKLFVPEAGFVNIPNIYFNECGVYRVQLKNLADGTFFYSPPIKSVPEDSMPRLCWGTFHMDASLCHEQQEIEACLHHYRDEEMLQFFVLFPFEHEDEVKNERWKSMIGSVASFNEDHRFTTFLGVQWAGVPGSEGLRQIVYLKDNKQMFKKKEKDHKQSPLEKVYTSHLPKDFMSIPSMTMGTETYFDFHRFHPEYEKVVEIYGLRGSSECSVKEGNLFPILSQEGEVEERTEGSIRRALNQNRRFGFVAGGGHSHFMRCRLEKGKTKYFPGLTALLTTNHSKEGIVQAISQRACFATTGVRMIVGFYIAQSLMGSELNTRLKPGLRYNRHITGYAVGTAAIKEILIFRNGEIFQTYSLKDQDQFEFVLDDREWIDSIGLQEKGTDHPPFIYYYMRVEQIDGHVAWGSPIWVDIESKKEEKTEEVEEENEQKRFP